MTLTKANQNTYMTKNLNPSLEAENITKTFKRQRSRSTSRSRSKSKSRSPRRTSRRSPSPRLVNFPKKINRKKMKKIQTAAITQPKKIVPLRSSRDEGKEGLTRNFLYFRCWHKTSWDPLRRRRCLVLRLSPFSDRLTIFNSRHSDF